jgi:hypothetical protein
MSDDDNTPRSEAPAARAVREALERQNAQASQTLDARAADVLQQSVVEQVAAADRAATRTKVILLHLACGALTIACIVLKVTLLSQWPALGELLLEGALFVWGLAGFKPSEAVLAHVIAKLEPKRLDRMLSLRPPATGNSLYPPPPAAQYPGTSREVAIPKAPPRL